MKKLEKNMKFEYTKRIISGVSTLPYGYVDRV